MLVTRMEVQCSSLRMRTTLSLKVSTQTTSLVGPTPQTTNSLTLRAIGVYS